MSESVLRIEGFDDDGKLIDTLARRQPTRPNWIHFLRAVPGLAAQFKRKVPGEFWTTDALDDGTPVATIACPCGEQPTVRLGACEECRCERFYLSTGTTIRVANSPQDRALSAQA